MVGTSVGDDIGDGHYEQAADRINEIEKTLIHLRPLIEGLSGTTYQWVRSHPEATRDGGAVIFLIGLAVGYGLGVYYG